MTNKLEWYVFSYDINSRRITKFNVFNSNRFYDGLLKIKKEMKKSPLSFEEFSKLLEGSAMYSFWAKSEYEIILSNLFCSISKDEIKRIKQVDENRHIESVNLLYQKKVDIYEQLKLNWDKFAEYVYSNIKEIK